MTLVLYFGHERPWSGPLTLKERLKIPKVFEPYVNDYRVNLFQIAYLTREQVNLFQSDFKVVAKDLGARPRSPLCQALGRK